MAQAQDAVWLPVLPSMRGFGPALARGAGAEAEKAGKSSGGRFSSAFKGATAGIASALAVGGITSFVGAAVKGAGDLEQSLGAIESVFKGSAGQMVQWSRDAAKNVGLTQNEFNELGSLIGSQLKNGGTAMEELAPKTKDLIGLGADLSSMFGGSTKDAVAALSSALKGERDPIEAYGVSLNQAKIDAEAAALGFSKVGKSFEDEAIQAATLSLIMKQTQDAHGNFAKEGDTFAGAQQRMAAQWGNLTSKMGALFLPALSGVIGFMSEKALPIIEDIVGGVQAFGSAFSDAGTEVTSSGVAGVLETIGLGLGGIWSILSKGDFTGKLTTAFGWEEDHPLVDFLLKVHGGAKGLYDLLIGGDFTGKFREAFGVEEDSKMVDFLFDIRESLMKIPAAIQEALTAGGKVVTWLWDMKTPIGIIAGLILTALIPHWVALGVEALKSATLQKIAWGMAKGSAIQAAFAHSLSVTAMVGGWVLMGVQAMVNAARIAAAWLIALGPVGWVILAVAGIGAAIWAAYENIGWFKDGVDAAFKWVADSVGVAFEWIRGVIGSVVDWFTETAVPAWDAAVRAIGDFFMGLWTTWIKPVFDGIGATIKAVIDWFTLVAVPAVMAAVDAVGSVFQGLYEFLKPVFDSIGVVVNGFYMLFEYVFRIIVAVIQNIIIPLFMTFWTKVVEAFTGVGAAISGWWSGVVAIFNTVVNYVRTTLAAAFTWFRDNVITPVWNAVTSVVRTAWINISRVFNTVVSFVRTALSSAFTWLRDFVIKPVFDAISKLISDWWNGIVMPVFNAVKDFVRNVLGPAFTWFRDSVIKPVWDGISSMIKNVWEKGIKPVFDTISNVIKKNIPDAFKKGVEFIKAQWDKLVETAKSPIRFVIEKVINEGLIKGLNDVGGIVGIKDKLPPVAVPGWLKAGAGFMNGGYTGDGHKRQVKGHVHAGEYVFTKEETAALGKENLRAMASAAVRGAAAGPPMAGSLPFIQGELQGEIARTRRLNLVPYNGYPMGDLQTAARAWNGRAGVSVGTVRNVAQAGSNGVLVRYGAMPVGGAIGYYQGYAIDMARNNALQRETVIHEVGHALGLHHNTGNVSIMHPMLRGGGAVWPSLYDTMNLRRLYGPPGAGARPAADDGGKGGGWDPIGDIVNGLIDQFKKAFTNAGFIADLAIGLGKKLIDGAIDFVTNGGRQQEAAQVAPYLHDQGGVLNPGLSTILNATRKPEAILNARQWNDIHSLASRQGAAGSGDVVFNGPVGWDPHRVAQEIEVQKRRQATMAGLSGVVFA